jgi:hypothetical protein
VVSLVGQDWVEEAVLLQAHFGHLAVVRNARAFLRACVAEGLLEVRESYETRDVGLVKATPAAWREMGAGVPLYPRLDEIVHHLLTVEATLTLLRSLPEGTTVAGFRGDEQLRSAARQGVNFAALAGEAAGLLPDAEVDFRDPAGGVRTVPVELLTSKYTDETIVNKHAQLPVETVFFADTAQLVERTTDLTGRRPWLLTADGAPDPAVREWAAVTEAEDLVRAAAARLEATPTPPADQSVPLPATRRRRRGRPGSGDPTLF